jgi:MFS family permease
MDNDDMTITAPGQAHSTGSHRAWALYLAAFTASLSLSTCWTAMPFVVTGMGGTKADVGNALAINSFAYMIALLLTGSLLGHLEVKRATRLAIGIAIVAAVAMVLAVVGANTENHRQAAFAAATPTWRQPVWIWTIIAAGGLGGAAMALYWPFLMSWVSASLEGLELNRRFGRYNGSWSGGGLIGPILGAWLVEIGSLWPMLATAACFVVSMAALTVARSDSIHAGGPSATNGKPLPIVDPNMLAGFRWMSRIALFCSWSTQAIAKSQYALLFVALGYTKSRFGIYLAIFSACNFITLLGAGRWAFWHYRFGPQIGAQLLLLAAVLLMIVSKNLWVIFFSAILLGLGFGFAYSSHLYYGAATSRNRSVRMAIHETVISIGVAIGAWAGGYSAENVGLYAPYWFAVTTVSLGAIAQTSIYVTAKIRNPKLQIRNEPETQMTQ